MDAPKNVVYIGGMDRLDEEITQKRREVENAEKTLSAAKAAVDKAQQALSVCRIELAAYERAASLRPPQPDGSPPAIGHETNERRGGRQPGSIKIEWRNVLRDMVKSGNKPFEPSAISLLAERYGLPNDARSVRERFKKFDDLGFVAPIGDAYTVTDKAIERFDLNIMEAAPPNISEEAANEIRSS